VNVITFVITMALFVFGIWLMSIAVELPGFEAITFFGGIIAVSIAVAIPVNILGRADRVR
jgi:hypothetical protein